MSDRFKIEPIRGIAAPSKDNHIRKRGRVRNKAMKKTKDLLAKKAVDNRFDESMVEHFAGE
jgi:hypothetical protein